MNAPLTLPSHSRPLQAGALAVGVHLAFLAVLVIGMDWQNRPPQPMQAELWSELPPVAAVPAVVPVVPTEALPPPSPPPVDAPPPQPPAIVPDKPAKPVLTPPRKDELPSPAERDRLARQEEALRKLDRQSRELQKQAQAEEALRALDRNLQDKATAERAEAARQAQNDSRVRALQGAIDRLQAKIKDNTVVPPSVPSGIRFKVAFTLLPDGSVLEGSIRVLQGSGSPTYDEAVQRAILAAQPLPMPDDVTLRRQMRDVSLTTTNLR